MDKVTRAAIVLGAPAREDRHPSRFQCLSFNTFGYPALPSFTRCYMVACRREPKVLFRFRAPTRNADRAGTGGSCRHSSFCFPFG